MAEDLMKRLESTFYQYTKNYDENIKKLIKERAIEVSMEEMDEILHDAKNLSTE